MAAQQILDPDQFRVREMVRLELNPSKVEGLLPNTRPAELCRWPNGLRARGTFANMPVLEEY